MASRIKHIPRQRVQGPPVGWRPRALSVREKLEIVIRQNGREPSGGKLNALEGIAFDHDPALQRRRWCPLAQDTIPASCDLAYIVALNRATHSDKTANQDLPAIAKLKRLEGRAGKKKFKRKIQSRGFGPQNRKFR